jgi:hypothetical protein
MVIEQPATTQMRVEETPEGMRVTLQSRGVGRWFAAAFLGAWLAGWAAGEFFAGSFLVRIVGGFLGLSRPLGDLAGAGALGVGLFLLVWLAFWTFGGVAALFTLARLIAGADVLTLAPDGWTIWQGIGRWGRRRVVDPDTIREVRVRRGGGPLLAETPSGTITLTTYGAETDRQWLAERLRSSLGLPPPSSPASPDPDAYRAPATVPVDPSSPSSMPSGFQIAPMPDGTTSITPTLARRAGQMGCTLFLALFWNGVVSVFVLAGLGAIAVNVEGPGGAMAPGQWGYWLFLTPFIAVGLGFLAAFGWAACGREEWRVTIGSLEVIRSLPGRTWTRRYAEGTLMLECKVDSDGDESWSLLLDAPGERRSLHSGNPGELRSLGRLLAGHTGWKLRER